MKQLETRKTPGASVYIQKKVVMKISIHPKYNFLESFVRSVPEIFRNEGECIYKGRNEVKVFEVDGIRVNIKSFRIPHMVNRLVYSSVRKSKAARSYVYALRCLASGVLTPEPIAYMETYTCGWIGRSYYLSIHKADMRSMNYIYAVPDEETKPLLEAYARFTAFVHRQGIYHKDYSPGNVLFDESPQQRYRFSMIDLNRIDFGPVSPEKGCHAFERTNLHDDQIDWVARVYAEERGMDPELCKNLIKSYHDAFWRSFLKRHPEWERVYR